MTLRRWFVIVAGAALLFAILGAIARPLRVSVDPRLAFVVFGLAVAWSLFLVTDIRWTANRMAVAAGVVYAIVVALMLITPIDGDGPSSPLTTDSNGNA